LNLEDRFSRIKTPKFTIFPEEKGIFGGNTKKCWRFSKKRRSFLFDSLEKDEERREKKQKKKEKRQNKKELPHTMVRKFQAENRRLSSRI